MGGASLVGRLSLRSLRSRPFVIAGVNVIESESQVLTTAHSLAASLRPFDVSFVFKASFDKANRTSLSSYRGVGLQRAARLLRRVREEVGVAVVTD
eukprot:scaffold188864_cov26-Tisochrysis_lutea.AAC.1